MAANTTPYHLRSKASLARPGTGRPKGSKQPLGFVEDRTRIDPLSGVKKTYWETEEKFEERCQSNYDRKLSSELLTRLELYDFDVISEIIRIYAESELNDKLKFEVLFKLMEYIYPKKKAIDITQHTDTKVEYISTIVFEETKKDRYDSPEEN